MIEQIESVATQLNVPIKILSQAEGPQVTRYQIRAVQKIRANGSLGMLTRIVSLRNRAEDFAAALGVHSVRFASDSSVWLEVPKKQAFVFSNKLDAVIDVRGMALPMSTFARNGATDFRPRRSTLGKGTTATPRNKVDAGSRSLGWI